ncbi:MAG: DUF4339 domain-containing protein [Rhodopirellula sp.]|nr:DUF4339 domain-containing protein [Rhodopirellula sp.]
MATIPVATDPAVTNPVAAGDPLSESPDTVWYVQPPAGGRYGPATGPLMRTWLAEGRVPPDSLVWRDGWQDWQPAAAVFPDLRAGELAEPPGAGAVVPRLPRTPTAGYHGHTPRRSRAMNISIIVLLALTVIVLLVVLVWVLMRGPAIQTAFLTDNIPVFLAPSIAAVVRQL